MPSNSFRTNIIKLFFGLAPAPTEVKTTNESSNENINLKFPFFIQAPMVLLGMYLLFYLLQLLQDILVPICFALLIAVILYPIVNKLVQWKMPKTVAIAIALLIAILIFVGVVSFLTIQFSSFSELAPQLEEREVRKSFRKLKRG